jgi:hypothetical protein
MTKFVISPEDFEQSRSAIGRLEGLLLNIRRLADVSTRSSVDRLNVDRRSARWTPRGRQHDLIEVGPEHAPVARQLASSIEEAASEIVDGLDPVQPQYDALPRSFALRDGDVDVWTLGAVTYRVSQRSILRGSIELRKTEPIAIGLPELAVYYFLSVPGIRDQLVRERHGHWGYHYHYVDSKSRRSDTLLTFDRNSIQPTTPCLCWERHAENGKFKARADLWGGEKRQSVYAACQPDISRFALSAFKRPAADAEVVWPVA